MLFFLIPNQVFFHLNQKKIRKVVGKHETNKSNLKFYENA